VRKHKIIEPIYILFCDKFSIEICFPFTRTNFVPPSKDARMSTSIRDIINSSKGRRRDPVYQKFIETQGLPDPDASETSENEDYGTLQYPELSLDGMNTLNRKKSMSEDGNIKRNKSKARADPEINRQAVFKYNSKNLREILNYLEKPDQDPKRSDSSDSDYDAKLIQSMMRTMPIPMHPKVKRKKVK